MSPGEALVAAAPPTSSTDFRASAFGLDVVSPVRLPGLTFDAAAAPSRRVRMQLETARELERSWRPAEASSLLDRRHRDGKLMMTVHSHPELGFRIFAPHHGRHIVSRDGRSVRSMLPAGPSWRWQRLMYAQVLPLCATLQGLELFHASAVELDGQAVAFIASSGSGKSSVATHLVAQAATLVTDDVLALEPVGDEILAHPGGGLVSVAEHELESVPPSLRPRIGAVLARADKVLLAPSRATLPSRLRGVYFLARNDRTDRLSVEVMSRPDPLPLLAGIFIAYVRSEERLQTHLDVCARIAASVRLAEVSVPAGTSAPEVARAVLSDLEASR